MLQKKNEMKRVKENKNLFTIKLQKIVLLIIYNYTNINLSGFVHRVLIAKCCLIDICHHKVFRILKTKFVKNKMI